MPIQRVREYSLSKKLRNYTERDFSIEAKVSLRKFTVIIHGYGLQVTGESGLLTGFYTSRTVSSNDLDSASQIALDMVAQDWKEGHYANLNRGNQPTLEIEDVFQLGFFSALFKRGPGKGHTFYGE
jgi:hypothetical protein